ncbi:MAG: ectoine/hydroxyectoine ABC transporter permease subunit EhuC, partial [Mesorhizobium sp.]
MSKVDLSFIFAVLTKGVMTTVIVTLGACVVAIVLG